MSYRYNADDIRIRLENFQGPPGDATAANEAAARADAAALAANNAANVAQNAAAAANAAAKTVDASIGAAETTARIADAAAEAANKATSTANSAMQTVNAAANGAETAAAQARSATENAITAANNANSAANTATQAAGSAQSAAQNARDAAQQTVRATGAAQEATEAALAAAGSANNAANRASSEADAAAANTKALKDVHPQAVAATEAANTAATNAKATADDTKQRTDAAVNNAEAATAAANEAAAKADAAREAIEGDLGAIEAALLTKAPAIECEASGSILTVPDAAAQPAVQLISHIVPVQAGSGDPSPENVRPISGWDAVYAATNRKNLMPNREERTIESNGITFTSRPDGSVVVNGTASANAYMTVSTPFVLGKGKRIRLSGCPAGGSTTKYALQLYFAKDDGTSNGLYFEEFGSGASGTPYATRKYIGIIVIRSGYTAENIVFYPMVRFENEEAGYEPYQGQTLTAALPETVYGGSLDWKTGTLTVEPYDLATFDGSEDFQIPASHTNTVTQVFTCVEVKVSNKASFTSTRSKSRSNMFRPIVQSDYAGLRENTFYWADASGAWRFGWGAPGATVEEFTAFLQANPLQILVPTTEGTKEYQLTPQQLELLKGLNNVWSDTGDTSLVYVADTKMYIDNQIAAAVALALNG